MCECLPELLGASQRPAEAAWEGALEAPSSNVLTIEVQARGALKDPCKKRPGIFEDTPKRSSVSPVKARGTGFLASFRTSMLPPNALGCDPQHGWQQPGRSRVGRH